MSYFLCFPHLERKSSAHLSLDEMFSTCAQKASLNDVFYTYVFSAYVENIPSKLRYVLLFLARCGKHKK